MSNEAPAISIVNEIILKAIELNASDVHLEPLQENLRVRFRIDGLLYNKSSLDQDLGIKVISRIKVLAYMNVAEKRIPQDGKFSFFFNNQEIDLRIATFPCIYGEKVVIRILGSVHQKCDINNLGFESYMLEKVVALAHSSSGFFLVTGPTGSGKTTTLHSLLSLINSSEKNIVTLEDPIEYKVSNIIQGQIYPEIGFTFEKGIRALLRQDPDVIMVGEIRDYETAQVAIQAALTGHLVFSTLHTNDAPSTLMRLIDMKIEPFLINASLTGILAQRLARKLCEFCKFATEPDQQDQIFISKYNLAINKNYKSKGCDNCFHLGYKGRTGIFQLLTLSHKLRSLLTNWPVFDDIYTQACQDGMETLLSDAVYKVNQGIISLYELARVIL